ncbi:MAG: transporter [Candidatus Acidiferrum sp.]
MKFGISVLACIFLTGASSALAQLKPQWMPGQVGLNAGILPSPGFTYVNIDENYDAGTLNGPKGNAIPVTGNYNVWAIENLFYFVPDAKFLGGNLGFDVMFPTPATGSLVADINVQGVTNLGAAGGGSGLADLWLQPFTVGWHLRRWDIQVGDAFMVPTGRYSPGASNNVGSGYFGNHLQTGTTYYITKDKGTSVNLFTDWEVHGPRQGTNGTYKTPGQAFTDEWGVGQILPLKKDLSKLLQVGVVGYDQWQVTNNSGTVSIGGVIIPASAIPSYSVHAIGGQLNYILPAKNFSLFFKGYHEYSASTHTLGTTFCFGGAWTLAIPKLAAPKS